MFGWISEEEQCSLRNFSRGKDLAVDLGTLLGLSASCLASGAQLVITIDLFDTELLAPHTETCLKYGYDVPHKEDYSYQAVRKNLEGFPNITVIQSSSDEPVVKGVDLLFVDAGHDKENVVHDFNAWKNHLKKGAVVGFHDYWNMDYPGVAEGVKTLPLRFLERAGTIWWGVYE